jgi:predicted transcriptional regulator
MQPTKPSKLELYLEILKTIENKNPIKLESIKKLTNLNENLLSHAVTFLEKQHLIEKRNNKNQTYTSTQRGQRLHRYFTELTTGTFFYVLPHDTTCQDERYPQ